jgi:hypothetical protein
MLAPPSAQVSADLAPGLGRRLTVPAEPERAFCCIARVNFARGRDPGWVTSIACGLWLLAFAASGLQDPEPFLRWPGRRCEES